MAKSARGAAYPSISLNEAVEKLAEANEKVGKGPSSKELYIKGLGYSGISGASSRTFAALLHFGLLEKVGQDYRISDTGRLILYPHSNVDEDPLKIAALSPRLFKAIYNRYVGERLPGLLANTLIHDFQVYDKSAKEAAENFEQTMKYAGLMGEDGVLLSSEQDYEKPASDSISSNVGVSRGGHGNATTQTEALNELPSGIKISFPASLSFAVMTGEFGVEIKNLESKAQAVLKKASHTMDLTHDKEEH